MWLYTVLLAALVGSGSIVAAQPAILPQGDPRANQLSEEQREQVRDEHLKQQGQGPHYRIEGQRQRSESEPPDERGLGPGMQRQDTGISDPGINPGQAAESR